MMGNFSFGDYYKDEAVDFAWDWVTDVLGLEPERLWATVHEGDPALELGEDDGRDRGLAAQGDPARAHRSARQGQLLAVGRDGPVRAVLGDLLRPRRAVRAAATRTAARPLRPDHGDLQPRLHGVRPAARATCSSTCRRRTSTPATGSSARRASCRTSARCSTPTASARSWTGSRRESGVPYRESDVSLRAHRVLADHGRAASFLIAEGVEPSNEGRGYICRRLLRRAIHQANRIGLARLAPAVARRRRPDGRRVPAARGARRRDRARLARRGGAVLRDARARPEGVRRARRAGRRSTPTTRSRSRRRTGSRSS